jgi:hypothetical protein
VRGRSTLWFLPPSVTLSLAGPLHQAGPENRGNTFPGSGTGVGPPKIPDETELQQAGLLLMKFGL